MDRGRDTGRGGGGRARVPSFRRGVAGPRLRVSAAPRPGALAAGIGTDRGAQLLALAAPVQRHRRAHGRHHVASEGARGRSGTQGPTRAVRAGQAGPRLLHHAAAAAARAGGPGSPGAPHARGAAAAAAVLGDALGRRHPLRDLRRQRPVRGPEHQLLLHPQTPHLLGTGPALKSEGRNEYSPAWVIFVFIPMPS